MCKKWQIESQQSRTPYRRKDIHVFLTYFMKRHVSSKILLCLHFTAGASPHHGIRSNCSFVFLFHSIGSFVVPSKRKKKKKTETNSSLLIFLFHNFSRFSFRFLSVIFPVNKIKGLQQCRQMNTLRNEKRTTSFMFRGYKVVRSSCIR